MLNISHFQFLCLLLYDHTIRHLVPSDCKQIDIWDSSDGDIAYIIIYESALRSI